jgi:hypothetical protein
MDSQRGAPAVASFSLMLSSPVLSFSRPVVAGNDAWLARIAEVLGE